MPVNQGHFCIKIILNNLERFYTCISQQGDVNTCVLCIFDAFIDSIHNPLSISRKKNIFHIFRSENKGFIYKKGHKICSRCFRQSRPLILRTLGSILIEKTQTKSMSGHVRFSQILVTGSLTKMSLSFPTLALK